MKAPEKIYLFENPIDGTPDYRWLSKRSCSDDVEYTRTDAFMAEIERRIKSLNKDRDFNYLQIKELEALLSFLDTLEVKEVDLKKEFNDYTKDILACDVQFEPFTHLYNCAKHFFELGLKSKGEAGNEES